MHVSYKTFRCCRARLIRCVGVAIGNVGEAALLFLTREQQSEMMTTRTTAHRYSIIMAMKRGHLRVVEVTVSGVETDTRKGTSQPNSEKRQQQQHREEVAYIMHTITTIYSCHGIYTLLFTDFRLVCRIQLMYL